MRGSPAAEAAALAIPYKFAEAYARRDLQAVLALFADDRDVVFIGTGSDERRVGLVEVRQHIKRNLEQSSQLFFRFDWVRASATGPVAWVAAEGAMQAEVGPQEIEAPVRFTGVLEIVHGDWLLVQAHLSLPAAGQEVGRSFPTSTLEQLETAVRGEEISLQDQLGPDGTVTILFSDIEESTEMNERLGDIRWMELLRTHNTIVRHIAARHGGLIVKAQGDGFMIAFRSGREAILSAIDMQREFAEYNQQHPTEQIRIRCGLHVGEMVHEADDFFGRNVVLAARIADAARPCTILVSSVLKALTESSGDIKFGRGRSIALKGISGTQRVHEVVWLPEDA